MYQTDLKPLTKPSRNNPFGVVDLEARQWTRFVVGGLYYGVGTFKYYGKISNYIHAIFNIDGIYVWYAHFGGVYDFIFFIKYFLEHSPDFTINEIIPRGSGMLLMEVTRNKDGKTISFYDSSAFLPFSLATATETFNVPTKKGCIDYSKIKKITPSLIKYLESDCKGLFEVIEAYRRIDIVAKTGHKPTIASQSLSFLRTFLKEPLRSLPSSADELGSKSYVGGRTEIFNPLYVGKAPLYSFDKNAMYPDGMKKHAHPVEFLYSSPKIHEHEDSIIVDCEVSVPDDLYIPLLWTKLPNGKLVFPTGTFRFVGFYDELIAAQNVGCKILKVYRADHYRSDFIFTEFVDYLYNERIKTNDEARKIILKLLMNGCYGRFALNLVRSMFVTDEGQAGFTKIRDVKTKKGIISVGSVPKIIESFRNVAIASSVTSKCRIEMWEAMTKLGENLYYTDTDNVQTTKYIKNSSKLGDFKWENKEYVKEVINKGEYFRECYLLPKTYRASNKIVMKGFDRKKIKYFQFEDFESSLEGEIKLKIKTDPRFNRFRSAIKHKDILSMSKASEKTIRSLYDKRIVYKAGDEWCTRPLKITKEGEIK